MRELGRVPLVSRTQLCDSVLPIVSECSPVRAAVDTPRPPHRTLLEVAFLLAFFMLAAALGPFPPAALLTGFAGVAAMAMQNALYRIHLAGLPPTTIMTGNTTQAALDAIAISCAARNRPQSFAAASTAPSAAFSTSPPGVPSLPFSTIGLVFAVSQCRFVVGLAGAVASAEGENP